MIDTIFALSSGSPPAAIAVVRISGPDAGMALQELGGSLPSPRTATLRTLRDSDGNVLDRALTLWFPGSSTATGEDLAELHLHGGRAVIGAVERALGRLAGLRRASPGEFTRRAFANGRIDLAEAEGLADLLSAETELQRRQAVALASGAFSTQIALWRDEVLALSAHLEALLDFSDEDDVGHLPPDFLSRLDGLAQQIASMLAAPHAETLREGFRVVLAGPPNSGKSSLFNTLVEEEAAITAPVAGTTRDVLVRSVALAGIPFVFVDTAGLRDATDDSIEAIGIERAHGELGRADLTLWLGDDGEGAPRGLGQTMWNVKSFADVRTDAPSHLVRHCVSAVTGEGLAALRQDLIDLAGKAMPVPGQVALNRRQRDLVSEAWKAIRGADRGDILLAAESMRLARHAFDRLLGSAATENMLDALFGRFCIGK